MFTTAAPACTIGAAPAAVVRAAAPAEVGTSVRTIATAWYRPIADFGFWTNHKHPSRRPPSPTS